MLALFGWQWHRAGAAEARAALIAGQLSAERAAREQESNARQEESRRTHRIQEALDAEHLAREAAAADLRRADAAAVGLRERARQLADAARCPASGPASAAGGPAADSPADLLAELSRRLDQAAGELADFAERSSIAGQLCQQSYEALTY